MWVRDGTFPIFEGKERWNLADLPSHITSIEAHGIKPCSLPKEVSIPLSFGQSSPTKGQSQISSPGENPTMVSLRAERRAGKPFGQPFTPKPFCSFLPGRGGPIVSAGTIYTPRDSFVPSSGAAWRPWHRWKGGLGVSLLFWAGLCASTATTETQGTAPRQTHDTCAPRRDPQTSCQAQVGRVGQPLSPQPCAPTASCQPCSHTRSASTIYPLCCLLPSALCQSVPHHQSQAALPSEPCTQKLKNIPLVCSCQPPARGSSARLCFYTILLPHCHDFMWVHRLVLPRAQAWTAPPGPQHLWITGCDSWQGAHKIVLLNPSQEVSRVTSVPVSCTGLGVCGGQLAPAVGCALLLTVSGKRGHSRRTGNAWRCATSLTGTN